MRTMIAIPCMDMVHTDFLRSCLGMDVDGEVQWTTCQSSLIYDARNKLAELAIDGEFDRVLWLDSDMIFDRYLFRRLSEHLDLGREQLPTGVMAARADNFDDYQRDSLFSIAACGFGAVMMTTDLIRRVRDAYGLPFFPSLGFGEDLAFCMRVGWLGREIWCDSSIKCGHAGTAIYSEDSWKKLQGNTD